MCLLLTEHGWHDHIEYYVLTPSFATDCVSVVFFNVTNQTNVWVEIIAGLLQVSRSSRFLIKCPIIGFTPGGNWLQRQESNLLSHWLWARNGSSVPLPCYSKIKKSREMLSTFTWITWSQRFRRTLVPITIRLTDFWTLALFLVGTGRCLSQRDLYYTYPYWLTHYTDLLTVCLLFLLTYRGGATMKALRGPVLS